MFAFFPRLKHSNEKRIIDHGDSISYLWLSLFLELKLIISEEVIVKCISVFCKVKSPCTSELQKGYKKAAVEIVYNKSESLLYAVIKLLYYIVLVVLRFTELIEHAIAENLH